MNKQNRLREIEKIMDASDFNMDLFDELNHEAALLHSEIEELKQAQIQRALDIAKAQHSATVQRIMFLKDSGRMAQLVEEFGSQFIEDYTITENYTVISHCKNDRNPNMTNKWVLHSYEDAKQKVFLLVYWRVYNYYIRNGEE